ncbi:MAG: hypothetical protein JNK02_08275 [Planctomycetes bacterium]|nr:hypothetical protein [Planctomycetota bacterium]
MSGPTADRVPSRPSGALLVGIAFGLMALAALAAFLLAGTGRPIDGRERMRTAFGTSELPFGLAVASATRTPTGDLIVVHAVPGAPPEPAPAPPPVDAAPTGSGAPRVDWAALPIPAPGGPPSQAVFLFVPAERGREVIDELVRRVRGRDRSQLMADGGTVVVARGKLEFRGYDAEWVHLRAYEPGPAFRDALRISLSTPETPCVLTATWPRGAAASPAVLEELTRPLRAAPR